MPAKGTISNVILVFLFTVPMFAGGPLLVGGPAVGTRPAFGIEGQPFIWNPAKMPIAYRVDPGPMAVSPSGATVISNSAGLSRIQSMLATWQSVSTAAVSFTYAGPLLTAGSYQGGDLTTVQQFNDALGSCEAGSQSPIIFDGAGQIIQELGLPPEVIGFTELCSVDSVHGFVTSAAVLMNGQFQDGVNGGSNYEITANGFNQALTHEFGHFIGLDHSQINLDLFLQATFPCDVDGVAGMPLMFPVYACQARLDAGLPALATDDQAWISSLYPSSTFVNNYATISGKVLFSDGISPVQGINVIARAVDNSATEEDESRRIAVSSVSGYLFTNNLGQSLTAAQPGTKGDNTNGAQNGSRQPQFIGYYQVFVPPGTYTIEVEAIYDGFVGGSSVGPLDPPVLLPGGQPEFWKKAESAFDIPLQRDTITVLAGDSITDIDFILNSTPARFDQYEDTGDLWDTPMRVPIYASPEVAG